MPVEALDLALANWGAPQRATLGFRPRPMSAREPAAQTLGPSTVPRSSGRAVAAGPASLWARDAVHTAPTVRCAVVSSSTGAAMPLCFIEPQDAIRVIAESVGREARRQLVGEVVRAWVDDIPEQELSVHYAKAIADLDEQDLNLLAAWHASLEVGQPIPNTEFLVGVFPSLGENRREALKIAAGFRGEEAFQAGVSEDQALDTVLPRLSTSARSSSPTSASSCTCGTAWAARTRRGSIARSPRIARRRRPAARLATTAWAQRAGRSSAGGALRGAEQRRRRRSPTIRAWRPPSSGPSPQAVQPGRPPSGRRTPATGGSERGGRAGRARPT